MIEDYPPKEDPQRTVSRCLFYPDRICIEMITKDEDKPCEVCDISTMWWKERKKLLATKEGRETLRMEYEGRKSK